MISDSIHEIFVSYAHEDEDWLEKLKKMAVPARFTLWDDSRISPGQDWEKELKLALTRSSAAILLVSDNFLASEFISLTELPAVLDAADENGMPVLWISLTASLYRSTRLASIQALHNPDQPLDSMSKSERKQALAEIAKKIEATVDRFRGVFSAGTGSVADDPATELRRSLADRYDIGAEVGRGRTAVIYEVWDLKLRRKIASES